MYTEKLEYSKVLYGCTEEYDCEEDDLLVFDVYLTDSADALCIHVQVERIDICK